MPTVNKANCDGLLQAGTAELTKMVVAWVKNQTIQGQSLTLLELGLFLLTLTVPEFFLILTWESVRRYLSTIDSLWRTATVHTKRSSRIKTAGWRNLYLQWRMLVITQSIYTE